MYVKSVVLPDKQVISGEGYQEIRCPRDIRVVLFEVYPMLERRLHDILIGLIQESPTLYYIYGLIL